MFLENVSRDILEPFKIYNAVEANGHSGKQTALLTATFTNLVFHNSHTNSVFFHWFPVSGQLQLRTPFLRPEGVHLRERPLYFF